MEALIPLGLPGGPHFLVELTDQAKGKACVLNTEDQIAHCYSAIPVATGPIAPTTNPAIEELGTKTMLGVTVEGKRTTHKGPDVITERWFSPELQINIETKTDNVGSFTNFTTTSNLRREEQDRRLFEVPGDFKVIDETGTRAVIFGGADIAKPALRVRVQPVYTEEAKQNRIQGTVVMSVVVGADGVPTDLRIVHSLGAGLDQSAVTAVQQWRWQAARINGKAAPVLDTVRVNFELLDKPATN
jgi:TonB family protein